MSRANTGWFLVLQGRDHCQDYCSARLQGLVCYSSRSRSPAVDFVAGAFNENSIMTHMRACRTLPARCPAVVAAAATTACARLRLGTWPHLPSPKFCSWYSQESSHPQELETRVPAALRRTIHALMHRMLDNRRPRVVHALHVRLVFPISFRSCTEQVSQPAACMPMCGKEPPRDSGQRTGRHSSRRNGESSFLDTARLGFLDTAKEKDTARLCSGRLAWTAEIRPAGGLCHATLTDRSACAGLPRGAGSALRVHPR
jgi:hypothetical protein